jgi:D-erythro-7,8-dihydroneopterin triphosphate epimerase
MPDQIHIKDLLVRAVVGINDEERRDRQDVLINLTLEVDLRPAGESDDIRDAVNYRTLAKRIVQMVEGSQFYLVEKLASEIAQICLSDAGVRRALVTVEKPGALRFARSVGVTVDRSRPGV